MAEATANPARIAELEAEVARHQVVHQRLSDAKRLLDQELDRFRVIQQYVERAVQAETLEAFYETTLESVIEAFEFEVALFLRKDGAPDRVSVVSCFGFDDVITGRELPFDDSWVKGTESRLLKPDDPALKAWADLDIVDAVLCAYRDREGGVGGLVIGGKTRGMQSYYDDLSPEITSAFTVMVCQAAALLANQEFASDIRTHMQALQSLSNSYSRFVPFEFLKLLGRDSIETVLPGDHVSLDMTVLYADLRGFTTLSETIGAEAAFALLNDYLAVIEPPLSVAGGFINHYQGDAITALFPQGADTALQAAQGVVAALAKFNAERAERGEEPLRMGIGINAGELMLGAIGGGDRLDGNVVGDTVNLTARTEGLNKVFGSTCVVTDLAVDRLEQPGAFALRELDKVIVAGRSDPVVIYELLDCDPAESRDAKLATADSFTRALELYRKGDFAVAIGAFAEVMAQNADDPVAQLFVQRCAELVRAAPPPGWDGTTKLDEK